LTDKSTIILLNDFDKDEIIDVMLQRNSDATVVFSSGNTDILYLYVLKELQAPTT
jgi:hypothetical protein